MKSLWKLLWNHSNYYEITNKNFEATEETMKLHPNPPSTKHHETNRTPIMRTKTKPNPRKKKQSLLRWLLLGQKPKHVYLWFGVFRCVLHGVEKQTIIGCWKHTVFSLVLPVYVYLYMVWMVLWSLRFLVCLWWSSKNLGFFHLPSFSDGRTWQPAVFLWPSSLFFLGCFL